MRREWQGTTSSSHGGILVTRAYVDTQPLTSLLLEYTFFLVFFSFLRVQRGVIISYSRAEELISQILIHIMQKFGA